MNIQPIDMEEHFVPGFKAAPLLLMGSQTNSIWNNSAKLQAPEDYYLAGLGSKNVAVVRNVDPNYITYFSSLMDGGRVINLYGIDGSSYLSQCILNNKWALEQIKRVIHSDFQMLPFIITKLELKVAKKLGIGIHGSKRIINRYGTKSGIRKLAIGAHIPIAPGYTCTTIQEIQKAMHDLQEDFAFVAIKHDTSVSGFLSKKISTRHGEKN